MRRSTFLLALAVGPQALAQSSLPSRTRVEIRDFKRSREDEYEVFIRVYGATTSSQPVVLVRTSEEFGLRVAADRSGVPIQPRTEDRLPPDPKSSGSVRPEVSQDSASTWRATFSSPPFKGRLTEIYAVVCDVRERPEWTKDRDYRGLGYLPFQRTRSIDDALTILRDFGWIPTGFTRIAP